MPFRVRACVALLALGACAPSRAPAAPVVVPIATPASVATEPPIPDPDVDSARPFALDPVDGWERGDNDKQLIYLEAREITLAIRAYQIDEGRPPIDEIPTRHVHQMVDTRLLWQRRVTMGAYSAAEFETDSGYEGPAGSIGHTRQLERCLTTRSGVYCVRCGQWGAMQSQAELQRWISASRAICERALERVRVHRPDRTGPEREVD